MPAIPYSLRLWVEESFMHIGFSSTFVNDCENLALTLVEITGKGYAMKKLLARILSWFRSVKPLAPASVPLLLLGGVLLFGWVARSRAELNLNISLSVANTVVSWTNAGAVLQTATNLNGAWSDLSNAASPYPLLTSNRAQFFRLRQPTSPAFITDIEPAYLPTSGGTFYLTGSNFASNATVYINGILASTAFVNSNLLSVSAGAIGAGTYNISVVNPATGQTNATLADGLTVESTPLASLEGPPGMPVPTPATGEAQGESSVDLFIPAGVGPSFAVARAYRSRIGPTNSAVGYGWDFSSDIFIQTNGSNLVVNDGGGRTDTFFLQPDGTYSRPEFFRQGTFSNNVFSLIAGDKSRREFNALNAPVAPGKIAKTIDRNGNAMTYNYNSSGQLSNVTDAVGRTTQFSYNGSGQLTNVTDPAGRTTTYTYDSSNNLHSVTLPAVAGTPNGNNFPNGKTTTYTYDGSHRLTSVIDPTGAVMQTNQYSPDTNSADIDFGRVISIALGTNPPTVFSYAAQTPTPANHYATTMTYINDPAGNVTMALYDSKNRPVQIYEYTGRATPGVAVTSTSNQPTGRLRSTDPAYYLTTYSYDLNSLPTQITDPRGNTTAMVYEYDANNAAPVRERGNLLTMTQTPAPGAPADQTQRIDSYQYQPGFGTGEGESTYHKTYRPGRPTFGYSFPTNHTDPRGNITSATYDGNGNLLTVQPPGITTGISYAYNAAGQLISQTHPADANGRRQQDTFNYYTNGAQNGYLQSDIQDQGGNPVPGLALTTTYSYDAYGNATNIVDPRGNTSQMVYNQLDQVMQISSPPSPAGLSSQATFTYDAAGTDGGRVVSESVLNFDQNGETEANSPLITSYSYDTISQLTSVTNEVSASAFIVTRYAYDANGEVTNVMSPLAASGADAFNIMKFSYDERGLLFQEISAPGSTAQSTTQYNYDANANLASVNEGLEGTPRTTTVVADGFARSINIPVIPSSVSMVGNHKDCLTDTSSGGHANAMVGNHKDCLADASSGGLEFNRDEWAKTGAGLTMAEGAPFDYRPQIPRDCYADLAPTAGGQGVYGTTTGGQICEAAFAFPGGGGGGFTDVQRIQHSGAGATISGRRRWLPSPPLGAVALANVPNSGTGMPSTAFVPDPNTKFMATALGDGTGRINRVRFADRVKNGTETDIAAATSGYSGPSVAGSRVFSGRKRLQLGYSAFSVAGSATTGFVAVPDQARARFACDGVPQVITHEGRLAEACEWIREIRVQRPTFSAIVTDPQGNVITNHYDANGNLVSTTMNGTNGLPVGGSGNVLLSSATVQYDGLDRLTNYTEAVVDAQGNVVTTAQTSAVLSDNGETTALTDANGHTTTYTYDTVSRLSSGTDPKGNSSSYTYDPNSNVIGVTNRLKSDLGNPDLLFTRTYSYDALDRVTNSTDNVGNTTSYAYDSRGNIAQTTDARGIVSQYQYDGLSRLTAAGVDMNNNGNAFDTNDIVTSYVYDGNSRLASQTDPNGNVTSYAYDSLNRCTATTNADATVASVTYDVHDNVITSTDANGTAITYTYDLDNRLAAKSITPASGVAATTTSEQYSYDGAGRMVYAANNNATNSFTYDSLDRRLTETQSGLTLTNTYDAVGNRLTVGYPGGRQLAYTYDTANLCRTTTLLADPTGDTPGLICTNAWLGGLLQSSSNRNGTYTLMSYDGGVGSTGTGDSGWGQVRTIQHLNTNGTVIDDIALTYDAAQNKTGKITSFPQFVTTQTYKVDNANRLTNTIVVTNGVQERNTVYLLDLAGNRTNVTGDNYPGAYTLSAVTPQPADFQENQYTTTPVGNFTYDLNGNRLSESASGVTVRGYSYDYANRMVSATSAGGAPLATYAYDALGRRTQKLVATGGTTFTTTSFIYGGGDVVEERNGAGTVAETVSLNGSGSFDPNGGAVTFVMIRNNGTNYYANTDDNGSMMALTLDNGSVAERYAYQDYGEPSFYNAAGSQISGSAAGNTFLYGGTMFDSESGFYGERRWFLLIRASQHPFNGDVGDLTEKAEVRTEKIKFKQKNSAPPRQTKRTRIHLFRRLLAANQSARHL